MLIVFIHIIAGLVAVYIIGQTDRMPSQNLRVLQNSLLICVLPTGVLFERFYMSVVG